MKDIIILFIVLLSTFLLSYLSNRFFILKASTYSIKKAFTGAIRWGSQTKPLSGGITFYLLFLFSNIFYFFFFNPDWFSSSQFIAFFLVITLSFIMGLADDIINTSPYFKLAIQLLNGIILIKFGIYIHIFDNEFYNYLLTCFWMIGIMNAFNMLDNMDAITTCVSITIVLGILANMLISGNPDNYFLYFILVGTLGSLLGFLIYNWHPSKMYMGDNGSQYLGSLLATVAIFHYWNAYQVPQSFELSKSFIIVILAFIIPIVDTTTVTINRIRAGKSPFMGGKDHTTHFLSYRGFSDRKVAIVLSLISFLSVLLSVIIYNFITNWKFYYIIIFSIYILSVFLVLYVNTLITKPK